MIVKIFVPLIFLLAISLFLAVLLTRGTLLYILQDETVLQTGSLGMRSCACPRKEEGGKKSVCT